MRVRLAQPDEVEPRVEDLLRQRDGFVDVVRGETPCAEDGLELRGGGGVGEEGGDVGVEGGRLRGRMRGWRLRGGGCARR